MLVRLQEFIHRFEVGSGSRLVRGALAVVAMVSLAAFFDMTRFRNLDNPEGMDAAQLARNLAAGRGFTTQFIRPLSLHLVERQREDGDSRLEGNHPDLANPPLYPLVLAVALKLMPFEYPDLTAQARFEVYGPDLWIAMFNQALFLVAVVLLFRLARRLFDAQVAWLSALVFLGAAAFWRLSLSGTSALLLVVLFVGLADVLTRLEAAAREAEGEGKRLVRLAVIAGVLAGMLCLTRYAAGWLILPVALWIAMYGGRDRARLGLVSLGVFVVVISPWLVRNWVVSGTPFGTAGYAIYAETPLFAGDQLERTLDPAFSGWSTEDLLRKAKANALAMVTGEVPRLGGSWLIGFFWAGLLVPFRNPSRSWLRYWLLLCFATLFVVQAFGGVGFARNGPGERVDSLLVLVAPLIFVYGVSLFCTLAGQLSVEAGGRWVLWSGLVMFACAPLVFTFVSPRRSPVAYPPYYPPWIMAKAQHVAPGGLVMTDIPWAVAWYADRQSVWLPLKHRGTDGDKVSDDFYDVHRRKAVAALYLTARTLEALDGNAVRQWATSGGDPGDWAGFALGTFLRGEVPTGFPLRLAPEGLGPEVFLTDSER